MPYSGTPKFDLSRASVTTPVLLLRPPTCPRSSRLLFEPRPLDDIGADTILRSSDGVDFRVYRVVLSLASPIFKDMFRLLQPASEPGVPVIPLAESSHTIDSFLRFFHPGGEPAAFFETLEQLAQMIEMAVSKYRGAVCCPLPTTTSPRIRRSRSRRSVCDRMLVRVARHRMAKQCLQLPLRSLFPCNITQYLKKILSIIICIS